MSDKTKDATLDPALDAAMQEALSAIEERSKPRPDAKAARDAAGPSGDETSGADADLALREASEREAELRDQLLRMAADFDNFRKRTRKEKDDSRRFGAEGLATNLLDVLDNFERALEHAGSEAQNPIVQGIRMVAKQLEDILVKHGVVRFEAAGKLFDPAQHEAIGQVPATGQAPGTVVTEVQRGYMMHERLLRPAKVVIAAAMPANMSADGEHDSTEGQNASAHAVGKVPNESAV